ncbi:MAG: hypothetical protein JSW40_02640 [Candidatus Omnitrophota bacterium]|nr:MAG: hypothetical protein JSW40_02640 [Candidatus Omnitrophota bacterium]
MKMCKAQSTLEYALLVGVVVAVLLGMQNYLKRSMQGRLMVVADEIGDPYSPGQTKRHEEMTTESDTVEHITSGTGGTTRTVVTGGKQTMTSKRELGPLEDEKWYNQE